MAKPTNSDDNQKSQNFVPQNMNLFMVFRGLATIYLFYLAYQSVNRYITTPEDRPSVLFFIFSLVVLAGGGLFVLIASVLQYRRYKAAEAAAKAQEEAALEEGAEADDDLSDPEEEDIEPEEEDASEPHNP